MGEIWYSKTPGTVQPQAKVPRGWGGAAAQARSVLWLPGQHTAYWDLANDRKITSRALLGVVIVLLYYHGTCRVGMASL